MTVTEQETLLPVIEHIAIHQDVAPQRRKASLLGSAFVLRCLAALASLGAAAIHAIQIEVHLREWLPSGMFFIVLAALQAIAAPSVLVLRSRRADLGVILLSLSAVAAWLVSRTVGLPLGPAPGMPEAIAIPDLVATTFEVVTAISLGSIYRVRARRLESVSYSSSYPRGSVLAAAVMIASLTGLGVGSAGGDGHSHATLGDKRQSSSAPAHPVDPQNEPSHGCDLLNPENHHDVTTGIALTEHSHTYAPNIGDVAAGEQRGTC